MVSYTLYMATYTIASVLTHEWQSMCGHAYLRTCIIIQLYRMTYIIFAGGSDCKIINSNCFILYKFSVCH